MVLLYPIASKMAKVAYFDSFYESYPRLDEEAQGL
jgi:hypothetical protein